MINAPLPWCFFVFNYLGTLKAAEAYFSLGTLASCVTYMKERMILERGSMCVSCSGSVVKEGKPSLEVVEFPECCCIYCVRSTVCIVFSVIDLSQCS